MTFPDLPHEPQDLDLVRQHLAWTPADRLQNLKRVHAFLVRARAARFGPSCIPSASHPFGGDPQA